MLINSYLLDADPPPETLLTPPKKLKILENTLDVTIRRYH